MVTGYNNDVVVMNNGEDTRRSRNCGVTGLLWLVGEAPGSGVSSSPSVGSMDAATGVKTYERYKPWGDTAAICCGTTTLPTRYQFTGQRREASLNGLYDYGARWYDSLAGVFLQPDSLVPDPYNPLDWNRYLYVRANPVKYTDSSGHCIDEISTVFCAMAVGAIVSVAVDAFVATQIQHQEYTLARGLVAAGAGALSGGIGAGIIAPIAATAGTATASILGLSAVDAAAVSLGTQLTVGASLSAGTNVLISSGQRTINQGLDGEKITLDTYKTNIQNNLETDAFFGAASFGLGLGISNTINYSFPIIPNGLNSSSGQKVIIGGMQALGQASSNSTLLDFMFNRPKQSEPKTMPTIRYKPVGAQ